MDSKGVPSAKRCSTGPSLSSAKDCPPNRSEKGLPADQILVAMSTSPEDQYSDSASEA